MTPIVALLATMFFVLIGTTFLAQVLLRLVLAGWAGEDGQPVLVSPGPP
jgi:hypothetical protein